MRQVISDFAERYTGLVMSTLALGEAQLEAMSPQQARIGSERPLLTEDRIRHMLLPHITAIAEEFSRAMLLRCSIPHVPLAHPLIQDLWQRGELQAEGAWEGHGQAWKRWHGISIKEAPPLPSLMAFVQARNAIMHGLGRLTRRQTREDGGHAVSVQLTSVGVGVVGRQLVVDGPAVANCAEVARDYIEWLDLAVQEAGLTQAA